MAADGAHAGMLQSADPKRFFFFNGRGYPADCCSRLYSMQDFFLRGRGLDVRSLILVQCRQFCGFSTRKNMMTRVREMVLSKII